MVGGGRITAAVPLCTRDQAGFCFGRITVLRVLWAENYPFRRRRRHQHVPKSDMLTVETDPSWPDTFVLGHRNGQISLVDARVGGDGGCSSRVVPDSINDDFGSVVALQLLLSQRPHQLLARGYHGVVCRLYDVRMFASQQQDSSTFTTGAG